MLFNGTMSCLHHSKIILKAGIIINNNTITIMFYEENLNRIFNCNTKLLQVSI